MAQTFSKSGLIQYLPSWSLSPVIGPVFLYVVSVAWRTGGRLIIYLFYF